jgi:putative transposase
MSYSTDLTDAQWNALRGLFAPRGRPGRRARISARRKVNAILWLARTGAPWRYLPRTFGPWGAVWQQFRRWRDAGVWGRAMSRLVRLARQREGRDPEPSLLMVDAQVVKGRRAGPTFHESGGHGGRTRGTKRTVLVDVLGLPVAVRADAARHNDVKTARWLLEEHLPTLPRAQLLMGDRGFRLLADRMAADHGLMVEIRYWDQRPEGGFKPIRPLWKVEDCFARLGAWRRLSRCFEATSDGATTWLQVACVGLLANKAVPA